MSGNNEFNRLNRKAKMGWAAFFQQSNRNHDIHLGYVDKIRHLNSKIAELNNNTTSDLPVHLHNELKELYELSKKEVSCPICLDVLQTDQIKFSSCSHKYCENCLNTLKSQTQPKCAICRRKIY